MHKLLYYSDFKDIEENSIRIEIYKDTDIEVSETELLLSGDAVRIECDTDSLFAPIKVSSMTIDVLTETILTEMYAAKTNDITTKIFKNDNLLWFGYLSPNVYNSDYTDVTNLLSLEFVDTLSQLDYFKYKYIDAQDNKSYIRSFYDIISSILNRIDVNKIINEIYISNSLRIEDSNDVLNKFLIQERNFFDEANGADTCKNILSEIIKYLSMTLLQYENKYIIIDYDALKKGNDKYIKYNRTTNVSELTTLPINVVDVNKIVYNANASISLGDVFNKIKIISNNNPLNNLIPELFDKEDLINVNEDLNKYYTCTINDKSYLYSFFKSKNKWRIPLSKKNEKGFYVDIHELTDLNINSVLYGAFMQKNFSYITKEEPSSINWDDRLTFIGNDLEWNKSQYGICPNYIELNKGNDVIFNGGNFILNFSYMLKYTPNKPNVYLADEYIISDNNDSQFEGDPIKFGESGQVIRGDDTQYREYGYRDTRFPCRLKIGDYYYDGEQWQPHSNITSNEAYYNQKIEKTTWKGYVEYSANGVKITEEEYTKIYLKDRFYLIHKNKSGERIKDTWKELTNQVSYKYNLINSSDGVLINLPDFILNGQIELTLYSPVGLGGDIFLRMDKSILYNKVDACHIRNLTFKYTNAKYYTDVFSEKEYDSDLLYENIINEDFVNEFDDLELYVNTFSGRAGSYSYVISKNNEKYKYISKVHNINTGLTRKQEEHIISKYYNYYSMPKYIYTNTLINNHIKPYSLLFENTIGKYLFLNKWIMNLSSNSIDITSNEI